jgi:hypothetical protein
MLAVPYRGFIPGEWAEAGGLEDAPALGSRRAVAHVRLTPGPRPSEVY